MPSVLRTSSLLVSVVLSLSFTATVAIPYVRIATLDDAVAVNQSHGMALAITLG